jgi:hypothetical protein
MLCDVVLIFGVESQKTRKHKNENIILGYADRRKLLASKRIMPQQNEKKNEISSTFALP